MLENGTNMETRCGDCGLVVHQAVNGRCPRCGARLNAPDSSYPVLPYGDLINPYETQYYSIRDEVMEGRSSRSWLCEFFDTFTQLSLVEGWTLNAEYSCSILEGHVVFFAQDVNGERVGNVLEVVAPMNDSPLAALDAVLLDHAMSQAGLYWHACYESREFIASIMDFSEYRFCGEVAGDVLTAIGDLRKFWGL